MLSFPDYYYIIAHSMYFLFFISVENSVEKEFVRSVIEANSSGRRARVSFSPNTSCLFRDMRSSVVLSFDL